MLYNLTFGSHLTMFRLKGNPKVIQFLQRHTSSLPPQIRIPNLAAEEPLNAFPTVQVQAAVHRDGVDSSNAASDIAIADIPSPAHLPQVPLPNDASPNAPSTSVNKRKPKLAADSLMRPSTRSQTRKGNTGKRNTPADDVSPDDSLPTETSGNGDQNAGEQNIPADHHLAPPDSPLTEASDDSDGYNMGEQNTPADHLSPPRETSGNDSDGLDDGHYEVERILQCRIDQHVRSFKHALWVFALLNR